MLGVRSPKTCPVWLQNTCSKCFSGNYKVHTRTSGPSWLEFAEKTAEFWEKHICTYETRLEWFGHVDQQYVWCVKGQKTDNTHVVIYSDVADLTLSIVQKIDFNRWHGTSIKTHLTKHPNASARTLIYLYLQSFHLWVLGQAGNKHSSIKAAWWKRLYRMF